LHSIFMKCIIYLVSMYNLSLYNLSHKALGLVTVRFPYSQRKEKSFIRPEIEIKLEFNQSKERKLISSLVNFVLIRQISIQSLV